MEINQKLNIKYIDFNNFTLLSWHIRDTSIEDISNLTKIITSRNLHKIIFPYEFIILSTCNRVEIYIYSHGSKKIIRDLKIFVNNKLQNNDCTSNSLLLLKGEKAYRHLLNVTCGLKSLALGEYQIQGQVKNAYKNAMKDRCISSYLISIFESALKAGKRIRSETEIGYNNISLSSLAVDMMFQFNKPKKNNRILVVGTGKMSKLAADYFIKMGYRSIIFFSNNPAQRKDFSRKYNSAVLNISELKSHIKESKFLFAAISKLKSNILFDLLEDRDTPISIIDLSVPSYFTKSMIKHSDSIIIDMDTIKHLNTNNLSILKPCLKKCEDIIDEEVNAFQINNKYRQKLNESYSLNKVQIHS